MPATVAIQKESHMPEKARCQLTVRHYECDPLGHVKHAVYVHYFEVGRLEAMAAAGVPFSDLFTLGLLELQFQNGAGSFRGETRSVWLQDTTTALPKKSPSSRTPPKPPTLGEIFCSAFTVPSALW
jgi:hypothetical protein